MKTAFFAAVAMAMLVILSVSCDRKKVIPITGTTTPKPPTSAPETDKPAEEPMKEAYQVVGYQKTACFGKCPVFQVKFYSDGKVTWYGKMNVDRMGWHEATVDKKLLTEIRDKAHAVKYWDFSGQYPPDQKIIDLPSTVTYVRAGDMEKSVIDTYQAPAELTEFEEYLAGIIDKLDWRPTQGK